MNANCFRTGLCLALVVGALGAVEVPGASAGSYVVVACDDATADNGAVSGSIGVNNSWETYFSNDTANLLQVGSLGGDCQSSSDPYVGLGVRDLWESGTNPATTGDAYWRFDAPVDTTIDDVNIHRYIGRYLDSQWRPYVMGDSDVESLCIDTSICSDDDPTTGDIANSSVQVGVECLETTPICDLGVTRPSVWAIIYGASITLSESVAPSLSVTSSDFESSGYLTGTKTVTFDASDAHGIKSAQLVIDGDVKDSTEFSCDFTYADHPCADQSDEELSFDVSSLDDSLDHTAKLIVKDAANNETESSAWTFATDNTDPAAPSSLLGSSDSTTNSFHASWLVSSSEIAPITKAHYVLCANSGNGPCESEQTLEQDGSSIGGITGITLPSVGSWRLQVWLEDEAGNIDSANISSTILTLLSPTNASSSTDQRTDSATDTGGQPGSITSSSETSVSTDKTSAKTSAGLRIRSARYSRTASRKLRLIISGSCAKITFKQRLKVSFAPKGGSKVKRFVRCSKGRWKATFSSRKRLFGRVSVEYIGDSRIVASKKTLRFTP